MDLKIDYAVYSCSGRYSDIDENNYFSSKISILMNTLAWAIRNNIQFPEALDTLVGDTRLRGNKIIYGSPIDFKLCLILLIEDLEKGISLSGSMKKRMKHFIPGYIVIALKNAEEKNRLDVVLPELAKRIKFTTGIRNLQKAAFTYPVVVFINIFLLVSALMVFIVPKISRVMDELAAGRQLPYMTQLLFDISKVYAKVFYSPFLLVIMVIAILCFVRRFPVISRLWEEIYIRIPWFGRGIKNMSLLELYGSMACFTAVGEDVIGAAEMSMQSTKYQWIKVRLNKFIDASKNGENWVDAWCDMGIGTPLQNWTLRNAAYKEDIVNGFDLNLRWTYYAIIASTKRSVNLIEAFGVFFNALIVGFIVFSLGYGMICSILYMCLEEF